MKAITINLNQGFLLDQNYQLIAGYNTTTRTIYIREPWSAIDLVDLPEELQGYKLNGTGGLSLQMWFDDKYQTLK